MTMLPALSITLVLAGLAFLPLSASARHTQPKHSPRPERYSWEGTQTDLSPIVIVPFVLPPPAATDAKQSSFLRRMNLENGLEVRGTHWISRPDVRSRDLFILDITQSLEGGFDSVNLYDKGLLSWGIMQWSARSGSLGQSLIFIKRRLWATGRKRVWDKTFVANGLDVDADGLIVYGKPLRTAAAMRLAFRGSLKVGNFDTKLGTHWVTTLARAGRQPAVAALQVEYAAHTVDAVLQKRLAGLPYHAPGRNGLTVSDLAGNDPYAEALVFALWTNNPRHAFEYVRDAADDAHAASGGDNPALWAPGAWSTALLGRCRRSHFGNWERRAEAIQTRSESVTTAEADDLTPFEADYRNVLAARTARRAWEMASRRGSILATKQTAAKN